MFRVSIIHLCTWCITYFISSTKCAVIKRNESEVGNHMLLVSEKYSSFKYNVNVNIKTSHLSQVHYWWPGELVVNLNIAGIRSVWFQNSIDVCLKCKKWPTTDLFCLIASQMWILCHLFSPSIYHEWCSSVLRLLSFAS